LLAGLIVVAAVVYYGFLIRVLLFDFFGLVLALALLAGAMFFFFARKWTERYEFIQLNKQLPPAVDVDVKDAIFRETCLLAALLQRAGSERAMEQGVAPGKEVITRRVVLDQLRSEMLLDSLEASVRDLLLAPDGGWSDEQKHTVQSGWEFLVALRWALGLDASLSPIWLPPEYLAEMASDVLKKADSKKLAMLPPWEMRMERDQAANLFVRCQVELAARDEWPEATFEEQQNAKEIKAEIDGSTDQADFFLGATTVSELALPELWGYTIRGYRRQQMLKLLIEVSGGELPASALNTFLTEHIAPAAPTASGEIT
jgi:hypothetical protein